MQGPKEAELIRQAERNRVPLPKAIQDAPVLHFHLTFYYKAFLDLNTCRAVGFDTGQIPWTAINEYAKRFEVDEEDEFEIFSRLIREMDSAYIKWGSEQRDKKKATLGSKSAAPGPSKVVSKNPIKGKR